MTEQQEQIHAAWKRFRAEALASAWFAKHGCICVALPMLPSMRHMMMMEDTALPEVPIFRFEAVIWVDALSTQPRVEIYCDGVTVETIYIPGSSYGHRETREEALRRAFGTADPAHARAGGPGTCRTKYFSEYFTVEDAGTRAGEFVGYRAWMLNGDYLQSFNGALWMPESHMEGDVRAGYGIFAFKEKKYLDAELRHSLLMAKGFALGTVSMWGEVIEHREGYRAQYARVRSIDHTPWHFERVRALYHLGPARHPRRSLLVRNGQRRRRRTK